MRTEEDIQTLLAEASKEWGSPWYSGYRYAMKVVLDPKMEHPLGIGFSHTYKGNGEWTLNDKDGVT